MYQELYQVSTKYRPVCKIHTLKMAENLKTYYGLVYQDLLTDKVLRVLSYKEHSMKEFPFYHMFPFYNMYSG